MKIYKPTQASKISNIIVSELNASVLIATFQKRGLVKADLYTKTSSGNHLVMHNTCPPVNAEFVETVILNLTEFPL